jgi:flagellar motor switch protein FliM
LGRASASSILTQEEVDALLSAVASGEMTSVLGGDEPLPRRVQNFEFDGGQALTSLRGMDLVHDQFAEFASASLSNLLSLPVVMARAAVNRVRMAEYGARIPQPSMIYHLRLGSDGPEALIQLGAGMVLAMIERLFGGPVVSPVNERSLTPIEKSVLKRVVQKLAADLSRAWARFRHVEPEILSAESQPELIKMAVAPMEPLSLITLEVRLADTAGLLSLAYPEEFIASVFGMAEASEEASSDEKKGGAGPPRQAITERLKTARVPITIILGRARLKLKELAGLKIGDVIRLETPVGGPLEASVAGTPKFLVRPGRRGERLAASVVGAVPESPGP